MQSISQGLHVLSALGQMPRLQRLALSDFNSSRLLLPAETLNPLEALLQLSHCKSLTDLELLHMSVRPEQVCYVVNPALCPPHPVAQTCIHPVSSSGVRLPAEMFKVLDFASVTSLYAL